MGSQASSVRLTIAVGLLVAAIAVALLTFASAASATTPPAPAPNPDLTPACQTKVVLILDESQSIGNAKGAVQAVRDAANAFAGGLVDSGSQLAVIEFGGSAKRVIDYTAVTSGAGGTLATKFHPYFDGTATPPADVYSIPTQLGPLTNWEAALKEVSLLNTQAGAAPLVVFITDGDPTTTGAGGTNIPSATAVGPAIVQANAVKAQGSHILAVGVGAALTDPASLARLTQVSGPNVATTVAGLDLATTDVLNVSNFSALPNALQAIVSQLCPASVAITKTVDKPVVTTGTTVTYTITVTNTGGVALTKVAVVDPVTPACARSIGALAPHASTSFSCTAKLTADTTNVATVTGTDPLGKTLTKDASVSVKVTPVTIIGTQQTTLAIDKRGPSTAKSGAVITYTVKITNTGSVTATNVVVRDQIPASMSLAKKVSGVQLVKGFVVVQVGTLDPGASKTVKLQLRIDRRASGARTNTASASASNARTVRDSARTRIVLVSGRIIVPGVTG